MEHDRLEQEIRADFHQIISDDDLQLEKMVPRRKYVNVFSNVFLTCYSTLVKRYTKRKLTNENDILDAFAGIQTALSRSLGPFYWGLPQNLLAQSLAWIATTEDMTQRSGFPSWTWAGWLFGERNNASYPYYVRGPCPVFIVFSDDGEMTYWSSDCVNSPSIGIYKWHDSLLYRDDNMIAKEWDKLFLLDSVQDVMNRLDGTPLSSLIFFWTSTVSIQTREDDENQNSILKGTLRFHREGVLGNVRLEERDIQSIFARPEPSWIGLAYIGTAPESYTEFFLVLIRWTDGIARRILPQLLFVVRAEKWEEAHPQRNLIILA